MKLLVDCHHLGKKKHGVCKYLEDQVAYLVKSKSFEEVYITVDKQNFEYISEMYKDLVGDRLTILPSYQNLFLRLFYLNRIANEKKITHVWCQYFTPFKKGKYKLIVTIFDVLFLTEPKLFSWIYRTLRYFFVKISIWNADSIITISHYSKEQIKLFFNRPDISVVYPPITIADNKLSSTMTVKENYLLYVSRIEKRKNQILALKVLKKLSKKYFDLKLVLVGFKTDEYISKLQRYILKNNLTDKVIFLENIDDREMASLISNAKIVLYPSLAEGFGMPVLESFLKHSKVLFANNSSMSEFHFVKKNMFRNNDLEDLADKAEKMLENNFYTVEEERGIKKYIQKNFSSENVGKQLLKKILEK